jgi:hypothetical protein
MTISGFRGGVRAFGCLAVLVAGLATAGSVEAQQLVRVLDLGQDTGRVAPRHPVIRVGKWVTLAGAAASATYGIVANRDADDRYSGLEQLCQDDPSRCTRRSTNGPFADAALEAEYQDILRLDRRAKYSLAAGQISMAVTVVLFILDLPRGGTGEDIPYKPPRFRTDSSGRFIFTASF